MSPGEEGFHLSRTLGNVQLGFLIAYVYPSQEYQPLAAFQGMLQILTALEL